MDMHYNVIISGCGPAGAACALSLKKSNLSVLILEKGSFPKDKTCGDAISGLSFKILQQLIPEQIEEFKSKHRHNFVSRTKLFAEGVEILEKKWKNEAYNCTRLEFDNLLAEAVKQSSSLKLIENFTLDICRNEGDKILAGNAKKETFFSADIIVGCEGANSAVSKLLAGNASNYPFDSVAVRAYYSKLSGLKMGCNEVYFSKKHFPGYFWIFPLSETAANVGFGTLQKYAAEKGYDIKNAFQNFIDANPALRSRFVKAETVSPLKGGILPIGTRKPKICGERFLLAGDSAALVNPLSGEGIGNAMKSGCIAAETIMDAFKKNDFSNRQLTGYNQKLRSMHKELRKEEIILRLFESAPFLYTASSTLLKLRQKLKKQMTRKA